ncbi:hypothetical protein JQ612_14105 [Bradyrhizobium manausense]|uniref:hypothetical protein n=1 Tax=Bradyrhizobium manausense TaxID=989370 RepID=UPI001BAA9C18|nr:hypothetical protein [Bradyrhizobium manausense]MBR0834322.1 hypothetical protein [Bradyrhizobium manausense]
MRYFVLALSVVFPAVAAAQSMHCPDAKEQQAMLDTVGTGPDAIENAVKFYSKLRGKPIREIKITDGVVLQWIVPETAKSANPAVLDIAVKVGIGGKPSVSCGFAF